MGVGVIPVIKGGFHVPLLGGHIAGDFGTWGPGGTYRGGTQRAPVRIMVNLVVGVHKVLEMGLELEMGVMHWGLVGPLGLEPAVSQHAEMGHLVVGIVTPEVLGGTVRRPPCEMGQKGGVVFGVVLAGVGVGEVVGGVGGWGRWQRGTIVVN